ncbi:MAG TPA: ATP-binding protein [Polyangiaceae bacterium]|jgi:CheY-like chemotaxis protein/nitrogen-specific signal transduction histidine kinase|nr:ATP-binding protein [Polyangiaceae bacterium]
MRNHGKLSTTTELAKERALRLRAEEANRIKDEFLATLSHELRTPLNAITGWAHILQTGGLPPEEQVRAVETILRNAKLQASLIEDLLDVSRIISGKLRLELAPLDLGKAIEAAIEAVTPSAKQKNITIQREHVTGPLHVLGDAVRLQQIAWNLLSNAVKFSDDGSVVTVRQQSLGKNALFEVEDHGRGISPEFLPYLFERFRQAEHPLTRARGSGLGLGLAIVRYLVEAHHGAVEAKSEGESRGATFAVTLPLVPDAKAEPPARSESTPPSGRSLAGAYVLVVDDDDDARELLNVLLSREGAEVGLAASAAEARRMIRARHPDVIVCDIGMPEQDGHSFMRLLRASGEEAGAFIPALALTGHAGVEDSRSALLAGFQMHVSKPLDPPRLLETVAKLWRRGLTRNT